MGRSWIPSWNPRRIYPSDSVVGPPGSDAPANRWAEISSSEDGRGYTGGPYDVPRWTIQHGFGNRMMDDVQLPPGWGGWSKTRMGGVSFDQPRELTFSAADAWIPIVYGQMRVGGVIEFLHQESNGDVYAVVTWALGEVNAVSSVGWGSDLQIGGFGAAGYSSPQVVASYTGTLTQTPDGTLTGLSGVTWDQALTGRAYSVLKVDADRDASQIEQARTVLQGLKVYDHRTDTTAYSRNPVLFAAAVLHAWWGADLGTSALDWDRIDDAADHADVDVSGEDRFAIDAYIRKGMRLSDLLDRICRHCRGHWGWDSGSGLWYVDIERTGSSVFTFTDTGASPNIDPASVVVEPPDRTRTPSVVKVNWTDKTNDYQPGGPVVKDNTTSLAGAREANIDLPWCTSRNMAARLLNYEYYSRVRDPAMVQWTSTETAAVVEVGDVVTLTAGDILDEQDLIVASINRAPDGALAFTGTEYETAAYSDSTEAQDTPPSYTSPSASDPPSGTFDREEVNDWNNDWDDYNYFILSWTKPSSDGDYAMEAWVDDGSGNYELWAWVPSGLEEMILAPDYYLEDDHSPYHLNEIHGAVPTNSLKMYLRNKATNQRTEWTIDNDVELSLPDFYGGNTSTGAAVHFAGTEASDREYSRGGVTSYTAGSDDTISTASEAGLGPTHQTTLTIDATDANDYDLADGDHGAGKKVYEFPAGRILLLGATCNLVCTSGGDITDEYSVAVGTATAGDDATLTGTEADVIDVMTVGDGTDQDAHGEDAGSIGYYDGTSTATALYLNTAIADASNTGAGTVEITGTIVVSWLNLGDY